MRPSTPPQAWNKENSEELLQACFFGGACLSPAIRLIKRCPDIAAVHNARYANVLVAATHAQAFPLIWHVSRKVDKQTFYEMSRARDSNGNTPLQHALLRRDKESAEALVAGGAYVRGKDSTGSTALHQACRRGYNSIVNEIYHSECRRLAKKTPPEEDDELGNQPLPCVQDPNGNTPLHWAAAENQPGPCVTMLLFARAHHIAGYADLRNKSGHNALHLAAMSNAYSALRALRKTGGPEPLSTDPHGRNALHLAAAFGSLISIRELIANWHIPVDCPDPRGWTALHWAAVCDVPKSAQVLLKCGASLYARDAKGQTALHVALNNYDRKSDRGLARKETQTEKFLIAAMSKLLAQPLKDRNGRTPLHRAAIAGKHESFLDIFERGASLYARDNNGRTPLDYALYRGHERVCAKLFRRLAQRAHKLQPELEPEQHLQKMLSAVDSHNQTIMHHVAQAGAIEGMEYLQSVAPHLSQARDENGLTPIHVLYMRHRLLRSLNRLFDKLGDAREVLGTPDARGESPVFKALMHHHNNALEESWDVADFKTTDNKGHTLMHVYARCVDPARLYKTNRVKFENRLWLLAKKQDSDGMLPLHHALLSSNPDDAFARQISILTPPKPPEDQREYFAEFTNCAAHDGWTPLHLAAWRGNKTAYLEMVEKYGADPHARTRHGYTPLTLAVIAGHSDLVAAAVAQDSTTLLCADLLGRLPLHWAAHLGRHDLFPTLLQGDARTGLEVRDANGETPICSAAHAGHPETMRQLFLVDAHVTLRTNTGRTLLHLAAASGNPQAVGVVLLMETVPINVRCSDGRTALHVAAEHGVGQVMGRMLYAGANPNALDPMRRTPLLSAAIRGDAMSLEKLISYGAHVHYRDRSGLTPMQCARRGHHTHCVEVLKRLRYGFRIMYRVHATSSALVQDSDEIELYTDSPLDVVWRDGDVCRGVRYPHIGYFHYHDCVVIPGTETRCAFELPLQEKARRAFDEHKRELAAEAFAEKLKAAEQKEMERQQREAEQRRQKQEEVRKRREEERRRREEEEKKRREGEEKKRKQQEAEERQRQWLLKKQKEEELRRRRAAARAARYAAEDEATRAWLEKKPKKKQRSCWEMVLSVLQDPCCVVQ